MTRISDLDAKWRFYVFLLLGCTIASLVMTGVLFTTERGIYLGDIMIGSILAIPFALLGMALTHKTEKGDK